MASIKAVHGPPARKERLPICGAARGLLARRFLKRQFVTLWAALWAETVLAGCEPVPDSDFEIKIAARTGRNR
jgi:hypothetical protein